MRNSNQKDESQPLRSRTQGALQDSAIERQLEAGRLSLERSREALTPSPEQVSKTLEKQLEKGFQQGWEIPYAGDARYAPPPTTPLRTGVGISFGPNPTKVPPDLPPHYPANLTIRTKIILSEAGQKFPKQSQLAGMCKYILSELTPQCCIAVSKGERAQSVLFWVEELLRVILVQNCSESERLQVEQDTLKSAEWLKLMTQLERVEMGNAGNPKKAPKEQFSAAVRRPNRFIRTDNNRAGKKPSPDVAKRRAIVKANLALRSSDLCKRFDMDKIPWSSDDGGFPGWVNGLRSKKYSRRIQNMICKDKKIAANQH